MLELPTTDSVMSLPLSIWQLPSWGGIYDI